MDNQDDLIGVRKSKNLDRCRLYASYLEPAVAVYAVGDILNYTLLQQYVYFRIANRMGLPVQYMRKETGGCVISASNFANTSVVAERFGDVENKVQSQAALINLGITMFMQIPSIFISLLFGAWSDSKGRRPALLTPIIGNIGFCAIQLLVMYQELELYYLFLASFVLGCSGHTTTMQQTAIAFVVDITSESSRIFRVGVLQGLVLISGVMGHILCGYGIELFGFIPPVWLVLIFQICSFLYIFLLVPESRVKIPDGPRFFSTHSFRNMWSVYSKPRDENGRKLLSLITLCISVLWMSFLGIDGIITLFYLASPLCFSSVMIGYLYSVWMFTGGAAAALLTIKPLLRRVGEFNMVAIGIIAYGVSLVWLAFCNRRWMTFILPVIAIPGGAIDPILKGWISKIVSSDEQGAMFSVVTATQTVFVAVGMFMFNPLYAFLVEFNFGAMTFLFPAAITAVSLLIICCLKRDILLVERKQTKRVKVCHSKEQEDQNKEHKTCLPDIRRAHPILSSGHTTQL